METDQKPDGRRLRGDRTRQAVLGHALAIAAIDGLEGLTFGRVALAAGVPKSTLQTLFGDREALQAQVLEFGAATFAEGIRRRLVEGGGAFQRLAGLCEAWFDLVGGCEQPGGCLVTAAAAEFRARDGRIAELVAEHRGRWRQALVSAAKAARDAGELAPDVDIAQLVFEILALQGAANLDAGPSGGSDLEMARRAVRDLLERAHAKRQGPAKATPNARPSGPPT